MLTQEKDCGGCARKRVEQKHALRRQKVTPACDQGGEGMDSLCCNCTRKGQSREKPASHAVQLLGIKSIPPGHSQEGEIHLDIQNALAGVVNVLCERTPPSATRA